MTVLFSTSKYLVPGVAAVWSTAVSLLHIPTFQRWNSFAPLLIYGTSYKTCNNLVLIPKNLTFQQQISWKHGEASSPPPPPEAFFLYFFLPNTIRRKFGSGLVAGDKNSSIVRKVPASPSVFPLSFTLFFLQSFPLYGMAFCGTYIRILILPRYILR